LSRLRTPTQFPADFIYILNSTADPDQYYTGITENVRVRLAEHNRGGCRHTRRWTPWRVIVVVAFASEKPALDFERYLKTGSGCAFAARHFR
jgi:predicted GIY-YIG superfamily endonuclease